MRYNRCGRSGLKLPAETNFGRILSTDLGVYRDELIISSKAGYDM